MLVCHPGGPGFSSRYFGDLAGLGGRFTLALLNPRGTEGSDRPGDSRAYTTEDYVGDLEEFRVHLGLERMTTIARFQAEQEAAMEAAVAAKADEAWFEDALAALKTEQAGDWGADEELAELVLRELPFYFAHYGDPERRYVQSLEGEIPVGDALKLFNGEVFTTFDLRPELSGITAPTLVITGEYDFICGPVCAKELAEGVRDAELVLLPDCGHFVFVEQRDRFAASIGDFFA